MHGMMFVMLVVGMLVVGLSAGVSLGGAVTVPSIFSENMVLQREAPIPVWGSASAGEKVAVSLNGRSGSAVAGKDGKERGMPRQSVNDNEPTDKGGEQEPKRKASKPGPPSCGMMIAQQAILRLEQISPDDTERTAAFNHIKEWIKDNEN